MQLCLFCPNTIADRPSLFTGYRCLSANTNLVVGSPPSRRTRVLKRTRANTFALRVTHSLMTSGLR
eukprot:3278303-Rhodomonas_salina.1